MTKSKVQKIILSGLMSGVLSLGIMSQTCLPAFANTSVNIETEITTISVDVPATMAVILKSDGTTQFPDNFKITNNSYGSVSLVGISVDAGSTGWSFSNEAEDVESKPVDTKEIEFKAGTTSKMELLAPTGGNNDTTAKATFNKGDIAIAARGGEQKLDFEMKHAAFSKVIDSAKAFDMTLSFELN